MIVCSEVFHPQKVYILSCQENNMRFLVFKRVFFKLRVLCFQAETNHVAPLLETYFIQVFTIAIF